VWWPLRGVRSFRSHSSLASLARFVRKDFVTKIFNAVRKLDVLQRAAIVEGERAYPR